MLVEDKVLIDVHEIEELLVEIAKELPIIRPISEFIHLNLLLPYQHLPFWEAVKTVSTRFEAMPFAELQLFKDQVKSGFLPFSLIEEKFLRLQPQSKDELARIFSEPDFIFPHHDLRVGALHQLWNESLGVNIIQLSDSMLIKWIGMYLDQGISLWEMPGADDLGFYQTVRNLITKSFIKPSPFNSSSESFAETPEESIRADLEFLSRKKEYQKEYLRESIFTLRGWAGLLYCLEKNPQLLPFKRNVKLIDFIAIKLRLEKAWILEHDSSGAFPNFSEACTQVPNPLLEGPYFNVFRACQEALEEVTYQKVLKGLGAPGAPSASVADYQAVFCMDDRESALRKHLEELTPKMETFGTAGHYGIECLYQHFDDAYPKKQCPAPLPAKVLIRDLVKTKNGFKRDALAHHLIQPSHDLVDDWWHSLSEGVRSAGLLTMNLFFPLAFKNLKNVLDVVPNSELQYLNQGEVPTAEGLKIGYRHEEMAELIYQQLMLIGFVKHFAPLVFIIGHGSNSVNNPYFATYGCGACSGRPGSANARTFVGMANIPEVRRLIEQKYGLVIPKETSFVAGFHDTCRDVVELFNTDQVPAHLAEDLKRFKKYMSVALYKNARQRSQAFKLVSYRPESREAQKEVLRRSYSLFETRPELGHTDVAFSIVGRRSLTKGLQLARPAFLQSYDRSVDPTGDILAASLGAVIPVTSGINLDYYFSRVDNLRFGAGSKLPQNIVGNIGVSHGTESDLLFGLPFQMIDQHTPLRLFVLVEQTPEIALYAVQKSALVKEIVFNNWVHYGCWDEVSDSFYIFRNGEMQRIGKELVGVC